MSQTAEHRGSLDLAGLQQSLWLAEAGMKTVTKIEVSGTRPNRHTMPRAPRGGHYSRGG